MDFLLQLPEWEETTEDGHKRFSSTFFGVADKFPSENVLCVTHGKRFASIHVTIPGLV